MREDFARHDLAREGLQELDRARRDASAVLRRPISRASVLRAADVNDSHIARQLRRGVAPRLTTVEAAGGGLLARIIETDREGEADSVPGETFERMVDAAAGELAFAFGEVVRLDVDGAMQSPRLRNALAALDRALAPLNVELHRTAAGFQHLMHEWLAGSTAPGLKLALIGAATAIVTARPAARTPEAAHVA
jgi:hypothetical protein